MGEKHMMAGGPWPPEEDDVVYEEGDEGLLFPGQTLGGEDVEGDCPVCGEPLASHYSGEAEACQDRYQALLEAGEVDPEEGPP